jgi:predicted dehydrogenase
MDVCVVGLGNIGRKEVRELHDDATCRLVGAVDPVAPRRRVVSEFVDETYRTLADALEATNPDLVRIATPPRTHHDLGKRALEAGTDVYIEKIMTTTVAEARDLMARADERDCRIFVRRNAIYTPVYRRAWNALDRIGRVREVQWIEPTGRYSDWDPSKAEWLRELPGGIVSEHLPHALYVVRWVLAAEPTVVDVRTFDSGVTILLQTDDQTATITYTEPTDLPMLFRIVGSDGVLDVNHSSFRISQPRGFERFSIEGRTIRANVADLLGCLKNILRLSNHAIRREFDLNPDSEYTKSDNYRQFRDVLTGAYSTRAFRIDGEEGLRNVELFERIWEMADD